jgi:hypothetical protein
MRYIAHLTRRHISTPLLTLVMMFKNARPSITCQTFRQSTSLFLEKRHVVFFTFYFYRPWQSYSTTHARLIDLFQCFCYSDIQMASSSLLLILFYNRWINIYICVLLKSSIKRKARVQYVDTFITSSVKSLSLKTLKKHCQPWG